MTLTYYAWFLSECLGNHDRAEQLYSGAFEALQMSDIPETHVWPYRLLSDLYRRMGRYEEARETLAYFLEASEGVVNVYRRVENLALMARVCLLCNEQREGSRYLREAERLGEGIESEWLDFHIAWTEALLHAAKHETSEAEAWFQKGMKPIAPEGRRVSPLDFLCTHFEFGEFLLDYGLTLSSWGEKEKARDILGAARVALHGSGLGPLERLAANALKTIGEGL